MGVSFLAPLFLAGLAALAVPIVLHLRRRREGREVEFPSLMFLRDTPHRSERRRTIRNPWLLALRLLALALLAVAFARPLFDGDGEAAAAAGPREVVLLVDRSWSMAYGDRWAEARAAAEEVAATLRTGDRATLVLFDEEATAPVRSSRDPGEVRRVVDRSTPGDRATRFAPALRLARSVLEASDLPRREVVLVSDFQAWGWSADDAVRLPRGTTFVPRPVGSSDAWSNRSVASVRVRRDRTDGREVAVPTARVAARSGEAGSTAAVLEVEGRERERVEARLQDGTAEVEFGPVELGARPLRMSVRLEEDVLPPDDVHRQVLAPGRRLSVLVVQPREPRPNASLYVGRALELSLDPPVGVEVVSGGLPSGELDRYDVVVLNDIVPRGGDADRIRAYLDGGGGVLAAPGTAEAAGETGRTLGVRIGEARAPEAASELRLAGVDREHPVFEPFREAGTGTFSDTRFFRVRTLEPTDSGRVVARFDDGAAALVEERVGTGRMLAWAATLHTFWTDLPVQPVFLPFVQRAALHLAGRRETPPSFEVGEVLSLGSGPSEGTVPPPAPGERWIAIRTPGGELIEVADVEGPLPLLEAGFYELLTDPDAEGGVPVAVNVDRREGDLQRRDPEEVAAAVTSLQEGSPAPGDDGAGPAAVISTEDRERHQGLWRFLLAGAFLFLVGETLVSNLLVPARATNR